MMQKVLESVQASATAYVDNMLEFCYTFKSRYYIKN